MRESPPGWYRDDDDQQLARWWDGRAWTQDTVAIGVVPPGATAPTRFPRPKSALPPTKPIPHQAQPADDAPESPSFSVQAPAPDPAPDPRVDPWAVDDSSTEVGDFGITTDLAALPIADERMFQPDPYLQQWDNESSTFADRVRDWPAWTRIVAPIALVALMVLAVAAASSISSTSRNDTVDSTSTTATVPSTTTEVTFFPLVTATSVLDTTTSTIESTTTTTRRRPATTTRPGPRPTTTFTVPTIPTTTEPPTTTTEPPTTTTAPPTTTTASPTSADATAPPCPSFPPGSC